MLDLVSAKIRRDGPLALPDFLQLALYHPQLGYYARGATAVGKAGDFFTSVSVGPVFGRLLAERFRLWWLANQRPERWRIVELGAHDGSLAIDVLAALEEIEPAGFAALEYAIPEPLPALAAIQHQRVGAAFPNQFHASSLAELAAAPLPGVVIANELIDALPFHLVRFNAGTWAERHVTIDPSGSLAWLDLAPSHAQLAAFCDCSLGQRFPDGYTTEVRLGTDKLLGRLAATLTHGLVCLIDYGFARSDYYHPDRTTGTLRTFSRHRAAEDPLERPGELDITAHVDFSALLDSGIAAGLTPHLWSDQGRYLTTLAHDWLIAMETSSTLPAALIRQFQTLTHPAHLGARFHVLELLKPPTDPGFSLTGNPIDALRTPD